MSKSFRTWSQRLDSGTLTKGQIQQFAAAITTKALGEVQHGKRSALTWEECRVLYRRIRANPVRLTDEHTSQGVRWLAYHGRKVLDMDSETHASLMRRFSHFTWDGQICAGGSTLPIWTVHCTTGRPWQYFVKSWIGAYWDGNRDACWWFGTDYRYILEPETDEPDYDYSDSFADAHRVSDLADTEIEEWQSFVSDIKERTERLRSTKR